MTYLTHLYLQAASHPYDTLWGGIGFVGQIVFGIRFLIQWVRSEQEGHSVVPLAFWYCSIIGGVISLTYAVHMQAWPLVLGQAIPIPIYVRNLYLIYRDRSAESPAA
ncbi:MAG: lipid-A-disaccharide synthase N-terminal domain-containing protein [Rhizomicrobium sp.]